jgi:hypothetical protein
MMGKQRYSVIFIAISTLLITGLHYVNLQARDHPAILERCGPFLKIDPKRHVILGNGLFHEHQGILSDKLTNPPFHKKGATLSHVPPARKTYDEGTQGVDDHIPHGIG